jgi:hypothetical protein
MFHLALYSAAIASASANQQVAAVADPIIAPAGNGFLVNAGIPKLMRVAGVGNILVRAQLTSASIREYTPDDIEPVNVGTLIGTPPRYVGWEFNPLPLKANEELDAAVTNSAATSTQTTVAVWFCDGAIRPVAGRVFSVRWTASATLSASAWTSFAVTFDNGIPSGTFAIIGSRMSSTGALFHRWIPRGGNAYRPGTFAAQADSGLAFPMDRYGALGEWMRFTNTTPPQCEVFSLSADTAEQGVLDLVQVA